VRVDGTVATYVDARRVASALKTIPGVIAVRPELRINEVHAMRFVGTPANQEPDAERQTISKSRS